MPKIDERIGSLEAKLKQLKVQQRRKEARVRSVATRRTRREDLRRKIWVGAIVLAKVEAGEIDEEVLKSWPAPRLEKAEDRKLFGLGSS